MIELDTSAIRKPDLYNFFYECPQCGFDLRIDYYDQVRTCRCGQVVQLSRAYVAHLRREKEQIRERMNALAEQIGGEGT